VPRRLNRAAAAAGYGVSSGAACAERPHCPGWRARQADAKGYYRPNEAPGPSGEGEPRLKGWVKTGADGRFEFLTIQPAPYPRGEVPAHVHIHAWGGGYPRQWFMLEFAGDPLLPKQHFTDNTAEYLYIAPVTPDNNGVLHCSFTLRMREKTNFP